MDLLLQTMDNCLWPHEIDELLNEAIAICPLMKRDNMKMYPANLKRIYIDSGIPHDEEFYTLGAQFLNTIAFDGI